jgi:hypothetical protein
LPQSGFELRHAESPPKEATLEEKEQASFFARPVGAGGVGPQEIADAAPTELWAGRGAVGRAPLLFQSEDMRAAVAALVEYGARSFRDKVVFQGR